MDSLDLILDTSRRGIALGIYRAGISLAEFFEPESRGESIGFALELALSRAQASLADIHRVLVTLGPGSFTGLRTGIAFCEGLCFSGKRSLFGVSTLRALRTLSPDANAAVVLYARTGFFYVGTASGEYFIPMEDAVQKFRRENIVSFVVDGRSSEVSEWKDFSAAGNFSVRVSEGNEIAPFARLFDELTPNLSLKANYIQPSYYERRGAMGVLR